MNRRVSAPIKHGPIRTIPAFPVTKHEANTAVEPRRVLVKLPTRSRPQKLLAALDRWTELRSKHHHVEFLVSVDEDDPETLAVMEKAADREVAVTIAVGRSESKIHAVNRDLAGKDFDVLVVASDDMVPEVDGWDALVVEDMLRAFPDFDGALHYNDGYRQDICTLSVMGKQLYESWGYVYHPDYKSLWCDNEFTDVARRDGKRFYSPVVLARHMHPATTRGVPTDDLYRRNDRFFRTDRDTYYRRRAAGFPREAVPLLPRSATGAVTLESPVLSLLVPTMPQRALQLEDLLAELQRQIAGKPVEILTLLDDGASPVGAKRNRLVIKARGRYVAFIDDDDMVSPDYVDSMLLAAIEEPDCITFNGEMTTDGQSPRLFRFSLAFTDRNTSWGYDRRPNHICAIRTDIARQVRFPEINFGEDARWSTRLRPLLKTETRIEKILYYYRFSKKGSLTHNRIARPSTPPAPSSPPMARPVPPRGIQRRH